MERRAVVLVTDRTLVPPRGGNQARIIELIRSLQWIGLSVVLVVHLTRSRRARWLPGFRSTIGAYRLADHVVWVNAPPFDSGSPLAFDCGPYRAPLERAVARYRPIAVIAEYIWMAPCLDVVPRGIARLIDTHDVMHIRRAIYDGEPEGAWVECSPSEEARLLANADAVIAIQRHEMRHFQHLVPGKRVICVPHAVTAAPRSSCRPAGDVVAYVGSGNQGNLAGLRGFLREAWPVIRAGRPGAELHVYGDIAARLDIDAPGVRRVGYVRDLAKAYAAAKVVINPVTLGTGLKIKSVEALAYGKALVTTSCGAAGIEEGAPAAFLIEDTMPRFGSAVLELLRDDLRRRSLEETAARFAEQRFSRSAVLRELVSLLSATASTHQGAPYHHGTA